VLLLGEKTGPFLWQLPGTYRFDADRLDTFMRRLPRDFRQGEVVARQHDHRLRHGACVDRAADVAYRHAFEVRHATYFCQEFFDLFRAHRCAFVVADTAGKFPYAEEVTADFVYVRLHGSQELYASGYTDAELDEWAGKIDAWRRGGRTCTCISITMLKSTRHPMRSGCGNGSNNQFRVSRETAEGSALKPAAGSGQ
jgi:uncharacterized protein YecE (DUF72 family)